MTSQYRGLLIVVVGIQVATIGLLRQGFNKQQLRETENNGRLIAEFIQLQASGLPIELTAQTVEDIQEIKTTNETQLNILDKMMGSLEKLQEADKEYLKVQTQSKVLLFSGIGITILGTCLAAKDFLPRSN